jgi:hypothetical protein
MKRAITFAYALGLLMIIAGCSSEQVQRQASKTFGAKSTAALTAKKEVKDRSKDIPGKMVFDDTESEPKFTRYAGYKEDKGKTPFDHQQHVDYDGSKCVTCHHTNDATKVFKEMGKPNNAVIGEDVMKCTVCHIDKDQPAPEEGTYKGLTFKGKMALEAEIAYHGSDKGKGKGPNTDEAGCITCHELPAIKNKFPKAAKVIGCTECHTGKDS